MNSENATQPHPSASNVVAHPYMDMANAIRVLSMDAVEKANSGHPGMPMGMADIATVLFADFLKFDPNNPEWPDRDRLILSNGHGSMLLYSLLYLTGYQDFPIEELKNFRQFGAKTAGHPEYEMSSAIETTTGPLGQGVGNAVGMAIAEQLLHARFGKVVDHYTYVMAGDGCLMEGISHEAISLAGHLKLGKLIMLFDDNEISIDGPTSLTVSDDQLARFKACGWDVQQVDGHDHDALRAAIQAAQQTDTPSMIACKTTIAYGAPTKAGTSASHGAALGAEEIAGTREKLGWSHEPFEVPDSILQSWRSLGEKGVQAHQAWQEAVNALDDATQKEFLRVQEGRLPEEAAQVIDQMKQTLAETQPKEATRKSSGNVLATLAPVIPEMIGGSADLTGSVNTKTSELSPVSADDFSGRYMYYGVREHGMCAAMNGMALHKGVIPYGGTFFIFTDYCKPSIRLAAMMEQRVIFVMTHDSIGLGEDGPTHQPIEQLAAFRSMPNIHVFRPADATETLEAWQLALEQSHTPSMLVLTRQGIPAIRTTYVSENLVAKGGYAVSEANGDAKVTLIATGSEVSIALDAQASLQQSGISTKVVSLPCTQLFDAQPESYKEALLGKDTLKVGIEAASSFGWERYIGQDGIFIGMEGFGASAPANELYQHFGITAEAVVTKVKEKLGDV